MIIIGIDEVGRGCWAGPLVAGAVALNGPIPGLKDSKKLNKLQREKLAEAVHTSAASYGLGWVQPAEIDKIGLTQAVSLAMRKALSLIDTTYDQVIVDGNFNYLAGYCYCKDTSCSKEYPCKSVKLIVRADDSVPAVSAASIIAKVARDKYMAEQAHVKYPDYEFDKHVGYGTKLHIEKLKLYGVTPLHRLSYKPIKALTALSS